jgi:hypothetical protein
MLVESDSKEEEVTTLHHARQNGLNQRNAWIDEDVIGLEPIRLEDKLNNFKPRCSGQSVAEIESARGIVGGNRLIGAKRQETALPSALFDQAECETRSSGGLDQDPPPDIPRTESTSAISSGRVFRPRGTLCLRTS